MLLTLLGLLDLWVSIYLVVLQIGFVDPIMVLFHSIYLFVKGVWFWGDLYSIFDIVIAFYLLSLGFGVSNIVVTIIFSIFLLQKSVYSLKSI